MRNVILSLAMLLGVAVAFGQDIYTGKVVDSKKQPIAYADVIAFKTSDKKLITGVITDDNGSFELKVTKESPLYLEVRFVGFETQKITPTKTDLGTITLKEQSTKLDEVVVTARKKLIKQKVDRLVFNVENSVASTGGSALDVLKATPSVQVNDNGVSIVGKSSVRVLVNDRIVQLSNEELVSYLSSFASDDIKNIEVITTPPAKYEAEGNGGLINIILKKPKENSWSNQIRASYIQKTYPAFKLGNTFNYSHKKWKVLASLDAKKGYSEYFNHSRIYYPTGLWNDTLIVKNKRDYLSAKFGVDYELNSKASIGVLFLGNYLKPNEESVNKSYIFGTNNQIVGKINTDGFTDKKTNSNSLNIHYLQKLDTLGKKMSVDVDYFNYTSDQNRNFTSKRTGNQTAFQKSNNIGNQNITNYSAKIDFQHPTKFGNFSYGGKITQTKTDNEVKFFDLTNGNPIFDTKNSNIFEYTENIQALYVDMAKNFSQKWQGKVGVRMENTQTKGYSKELNKTNTRKYLKFFPTFYLNYIKNQNNIFNVSYSKRLIRPSFFRLNPFRFYTSSNSYVVGNPYLEPIFSDNIELKYIYKSKYITELFFVLQEGVTGQIMTANNSIQVHRFENVGNAKVYGLKQTILFNPFKWWNTTNLFAIYNADMDLYKDLNFTSKVFGGWNYQFYTNHIFLLNQEGTLQAEATFFANSKGYGLLYEAKPFCSLDLGLKMQFLDRKLQVTAKLNDVFNSSAPDVIACTNNIKERYYNNWDNRYFTLGLTYKFGNKKIRVRERNLGNKDELNRAK
ncbi:MAG: TonB-dependent receptor [Flavobacteriaceae bacterium]|nr:TonB-dependent receptor [Flavobacteriaceae bacterium]